MKYFKKNDIYLLVLDKGEDLFKSLESWAVKENIVGGTLSGIGALKDVELGFYHLDKKEYDRKLFKREYELLSLEGNLTFLENKPFFHIHTVLGDEDFNAFGGHLFSATIAVTCEINFRVFNEKAHRDMDDSIGLNLISRCGIKA
ncbi:MAG: DNA-binding protein [Halobacteriovoraceae bacterium]|nr:DNA-binding protein [Halobacteriovoraceae bacterium]